MLLWVKPGPAQWLRCRHELFNAHDVLRISFFLHFDNWFVQFELQRVQQRHTLLLLVFCCCVILVQIREIRYVDLEVYRHANLLPPLLVLLEGDLGGLAAKLCRVGSLGAQLGLF